jgi:hypothetical protein
MSIVAISTASMLPFKLASLVRYICKIGASLGVMGGRILHFASLMLSIAKPSGTFALTPTSSPLFPLLYRIIALYSLPMIGDRGSLALSSLRIFGFGFPGS